MPDISTVLRFPIQVQTMVNTRRTQGVTLSAAMDDPERLIRGCGKQRTASERSGGRDESLGISARQATLPVEEAPSAKRRRTDLAFVAGTVAQAGPKEEPPQRSPNIEQLQNLLRLCKASPGAQTARIELAAVLLQHGYAPMLKDLKISSAHYALAGLDLSGISFDNCEFDWNHLNDSIIQASEFRNCRFRNASFMHSQLRNCEFRNCDFQEAMMVNTEMSGVLFEHCSMAASSFEDARLLGGCVFRESRLPGAHFLSAAVSDCRIERSDLTDTVFFGTEKAFDIDKASALTSRVTKPTTATLVFPESRGVSVPLVGAKIAGVADTLALRVAMRAPKLNPTAVDAEVERFLEELSRVGGDGQPSLAQRLVINAIERPEALPSASSVMAKARTIVEHVDSVVLPGGEDVAPKLYGQQQAPETDWKGDYRRSLLELGLIHYCFNRGVPLMAICRGFQIASVYFGASLHQHVGHQVGVRILDRGVPQHETTKEQTQGIFGRALNDIRAAVYHHQAVVASEGGIAYLQPSLKRTIADTETGSKWEAIMAFESSEPRAPLIGVQFHPEFFKDASTLPESAALDNERLEEMASPMSARTPPLRA